MRFREHLTNPLVAVLDDPPACLLLVGLGAGVVFCVCSYLLGVGFFSVDLGITPAGESKPVFVSLDLGYITQLNYGPWNVLGCPIVLLLCALVAHATRMVGPQEVKDSASFRALTRRSWVARTGWVLIVFFVTMNLWVELRDYNSLGLGWVQGEAAEKWSSTIARTNKPFAISELTFHYIELPPAGAVTKRVHADSVVVRKVYPERMHVGWHAGMLGFIAIVKIWAGLWEALVVFVGLLAIPWGRDVLRSITARNIDTAKDENGNFFAERPLVFLLLIGILANVFIVARYSANIAKGSFGSFDQYISLLIILPGLVAAFLGAAVFYRAFFLAPEKTAFSVSKGALSVLALWAATTLPLVLTLVSLVDPSTYRVIKIGFCQLLLKVCPTIPS